MTVGALCDLGVEPALLEAELRKLSLGETHFQFARETRQGISGLKFSVSENNHAHGRSYEQIRALLSGGALSDFVRQKALAIFKRIAVAEAKIHGVPVAAVGFHEIGAADSIADIVGACVALEALGRPRVIVSPLREGRGWIDCAHGRFPLPAPATLEILCGVALQQVDETWESITPIGAAIAREVRRIIRADAAAGNRARRLWHRHAGSEGASQMFCAPSSAGKARSPLTNWKPTRSSRSKPIWTIFRRS